MKTVKLRYRNEPETLEISGVKDVRLLGDRVFMIVSGAPETRTYIPCDSIIFIITTDDANL